MSDEPQSYASVKDRLDEIVAAVSDDDISLDDALTLYEEAVRLGLQVSSLLEDDISETQVASVLAEQESSDSAARAQEDSAPATVEHEEEIVGQGDLGDADQEPVEGSDSFIDEE